MRRFLKYWTGSDWAQRVVKKRWVPITRIAEGICRASGYRVLVYAKHRAWEQACGISAGMDKNPKVHA